MGTNQGLLAEPFRPLNPFKTIRSHSIKDGAIVLRDRGASYKLRYAVHFRDDKADLLKFGYWTDDRDRALDEFWKRVTQHRRTQRRLSAAG